MITPLQEHLHVGLLLHGETLAMWGSGRPQNLWESLLVPACRDCVRTVQGDVRVTDEGEVETSGRAAPPYVQ